jgi:Na+-transporting NADH:ubiquinone oxidoreductase subunit NqrC
MRTLIKCGEAGFLKGSDADPEGCLQVYINDELKIFLKVVGVIDVKVAYEKLQGTADTIQKRLTDAITKTKKANYKEKVAAAVQEEDAKKIK